MVYRRFGFLQARLLLNKQDELRELEDDLDLTDGFDVVRDPRSLKSRERDTAQNTPRRRVLADIEVKFKEYGLGLLSLSRVDSD